jgi:uncharacterized membrane protein
MKDTLNRFTSRKFLLAIVGLVLITAVPDQANDIVALIGMFVGAEGAKDLADAVKRNK